MVLKKRWNAKLGWLRSLTWQDWLLVIAPLTLLFAILVGAGTYLQHFVYSQLEGGPPTVQEAAVGDEIPLLPSLAVWLAETTYPPFLLIGLLTALVTSRGSSPRYMALFAGLSLAVFISLADLIELLVSASFDIEGMVKNIAANLVGGGLAALIVVVALSIYESVVERFGSGRGYLALAAVSMPTLGAVLSICLYYLLFFFYQPVMVRLEFTIVPPAQGFYSPTSEGRSLEATTKNLTFMPGQVIDAFASVTAYEGALDVRWRAFENEQKFRAEIYLTSDCGDLSQVQALLEKKTKPYLTSANIRDFRVTNNEGSAFVVFAPDQESGFSADLDGPTFFWVNKNPSSKKLETSLFFSRKDQLVRKARGTTEFFLNSVLLRSEDKESRPTARSFAINLGTGVQKVTFQPQHFINRKRKLQCHFLNVPASQNSIVSPDTAGFVAGMYVKLIPIEAPLGAYHTFDNELVLSGFGGQVRVGGIDAKDLKGDELGASDFVSISSGLSKMKVDDVEVAAKRDDQIYALGHITGSREAEGSIRFSGAARAAWKNGTRINKSRWERLSTEWQLAVLGWIGGLLFGLFKVWPVIARRVREDTPFRMT